MCAPSPGVPPYSVRPAAWMVCWPMPSEPTLSEACQATWAWSDVIQPVGTLVQRAEGASVSRTRMVG